MTLAMITVLPPATARLINLFLGPTEHFLLLQTSFTAAFVICCVLYDWFKYRLLHPVYVIGGTLLVRAHRGVGTRRPLDGKLVRRLLNRPHLG